MAEHKHIDEMEAKVTGFAIEFQGVENSILENNLYGVDINEESVGIAQLALWLRTAKPHRKLNALNQNIKCGNSLISDPAIAGDKAFDWQKEFPQVFEKGGFDVVIGNPPYVSAPNQVASQELSKQREAIINSEKYSSLFQKWDLYIPFIELGIKHLCKDNGLSAMIVPYPLTNQLYAKKSREMLLDEFSLYEVSDLKGTKVFEDAAVTSTIFFVQKARKEQIITISKIEDGVLQPVYTKNRDDLVQDDKTFVWNLEHSVSKSKRHEDMNVLGDFCYVSVGMVLNADENIAKGEFVKDDLISEIKDDIHCKEYVEGKDLERYQIKRVRYLEYGTERCPAKIRRKTFPELYTNRKLVINGLGNFKVILDSKGSLCSNHKGQLCLLWKDLCGVENTSIETSIKKYSKLSRKEMESLSKECDLRFLLAILNSKYAIELLNNIRGGDMNIYPEHIRNIPIPAISYEAQQPFITLADTMLTLHLQLQDKRSRFLRRLSDNFEGVKITTALQQFDTMDFKGLMAELKKQKIKLSLSQQDEWEDYFNERVAECQDLSAQIKATDNEIDNRVFDLYGLTEEVSRGRITEGNIIDGPQVVTPGIEHAYENFERIFGDRNNRMTLRYKNQKGEESSFPCYVRAHDLGVVLLRIDKLKNVYVYEEEWAGPIPEIKKKGHESHPNCHIIIDNREDFHQIAIEIEPAAWRDTRKVRDILQAGLNEELKRFGLVITINAKTMPEDYWQLTQRKRKKEHKALKKLTIGFDTSKMTSQAQHIIDKTMRIKSLMTMIDLIGGSKGTLDLQSLPGTDELLRKKLADIKHIVELCGENTYWLALTFSDGVTYRCGENVRAELPMNPPSIKEHFAKGDGYLDLWKKDHDILKWLNWVKEQTKKFKDVG